MAGLIDLAAAAARFSAFALAMDEEEDVLLEEIGRRIARRASDKMGGLGQPASHGYPAWEPLAAATVAKKGHARMLFEEGDLKGSFGYVVHKAEKAVTAGTNDEAAPPNELGTSHAPPRPFLRPAALEVMDEMEPELGGRILRQVFKTNG